MLDDIDDGARTGVWVALGVVAFVLFGLLGGLVLRQLNAGRAAAAPAPSAATAAMPATAAAAPGATVPFTVGPATPGPAATAAADTAAAAPAAAAAATATTAAAAADALADVPLTGDLAGTLFFASGSAVPAGDAAATFARIRDAANAAPARRLVISGFHDSTGNAARNAELAKQRAIAVREALAGLGVDRARLVLRKPAVTADGGDAAQARRVEVRTVD